MHPEGTGGLYINLLIALLLTKKYFIDSAEKNVC